MIKKTTLAVLGLAASSFAVAGTMGPVCTPGNVTVPCEARQWDLGVQALYLRSLFDADRSYQSSLTNSSVEAKNDWDWGYRIEGSAHFNTGNDATMTWMHFQSNANNGNFVGLIPISPVVAPFTSGFTRISQDEFDQVNMVMGQHVDVGMVKKMRFYGGLQYAHIRAYATNFYFASPFTALGLPSVSQTDNADYKGLGPVIGVDYAYHFSNEFSLTANGGGSILYGTSRISNGYVGAPLGLVIASRSGKRGAMVPSLEAKLGLNYACNMAMGTLNIEGGYQAVNYFNALQSTGRAGFVGPIADSDYGLYGPYLGLKYVGNA